MSKTKSGRHRLSKTDKRLLAALVVAGYEERTARDLILKHVYTLTQADLRHLVSEISNGVVSTPRLLAVTVLYHWR
ncbi:hypothetical protein P4P03_004954 [Escherichia coli]|nr:hypothetical protein [Escherichia coli]EKM2754438.1 hypothetical protein [Escherichia coli]EKP9810847.1 hypothetical protein [Escherichia coli]EKQ0165118.1 hypothetical protein [Escherichia coli]EKQ0293562.1 hypothetical protein [Escherichia coli]